MRRRPCVPVLVLAAIFVAAVGAPYGLLAQDRLPDCCKEAGRCATEVQRARGCCSLTPAQGGPVPQAVTGDLLQRGRHAGDPALEAPAGFSALNPAPPEIRAVSCSGPPGPVHPQPLYILNTALLR